MGEPAKKLERFTYQDFCLWPDDERWELIEGEAYNMSPAPSPTHQRIVREFLLQLGNYLKDKSCEVFISPFDVRFPEFNESDEEVDTVVQPDVLVVCDPNKIDEKGCRGAPDLIIEILSKYTSFKDKKIKMDLYEKHGVQEYWTIEPADQTVMVFRMTDGKYTRPEVYSVDDTIETPLLKDFSADLKVVFQIKSEKEPTQ